MHPAGRLEAIVGDDVGLLRQQVAQLIVGDALLRHRAAQLEALLQRQLLPRRWLLQRQPGEASGSAARFECMSGLCERRGCAAMGALRRESGTAAKPARVSEQLSISARKAAAGPHLDASCSLTDATSAACCGVAGASVAMLGACVRPPRCADADVGRCPCNQLSSQVRVEAPPFPRVWESAKCDRRLSGQAREEPAVTIHQPVQIAQFDCAAKSPCCSRWSGQFEGRRNERRGFGRCNMFVAPSDLVPAAAALYPGGGGRIGSRCMPS